MCGISGSGKTYYSKQLEEKGYKRLSLDEYIWSKYGSGFASMPFEQQSKIFMKASDEMENILSDHIDNGDRIVFDSTMCKRIKREKMRELCLKHGVEPLFIYLKTPLHVLKERLSTRKGTSPNDQIVPLEQLENFFNNFEAPSPQEQCVII